MSELPEPGDRIELIEMPDDPCPIEPGTTGTVRRVTKLWDGKTQLGVEWDTERSLCLIVPKDRFRIIGKESVA